MKIKALIQSRGEYMPVTEVGHIGRKGSHTQGFRVVPSESWRIVGAVTRNNFGYVTRRYTLEEILSDPSGIPWKHANGAQKTFLLDSDHGTTREWCHSHCMTKP